MLILISYVSKMTIEIQVTQAKLSQCKTHHLIHTSSQGIQYAYEDISRIASVILLTFAQRHGDPQL